MTPGSFYFDPEGAGTAVFLGPTETRLMDLLWQHGALSGKQVLFHLKGGSDIAYTTAMTILTRLSEKGLLVRIKQGRNFVYEPSVSRDEFLRDRITRVNACLAHNFPNLT